MVPKWRCLNIFTVLIKTKCCFEINDLNNENSKRIQYTEATLQTIHSSFQNWSYRCRCKKNRYQSSANWNGCKRNTGILGQRKIIIVTQWCLLKSVILNSSQAWFATRTWFSVKNNPRNGNSRVDLRIVTCNLHIF